MATRTSRHPIHDEIGAVVEAAIARALPSLQRAIEAAVAARVRQGKAAGAGRPARRNVVARPSELKRWVADRRARRVPTFVIEATGLATKKAIVARFGPNATFTRGKALPQAKPAKAHPPPQGERVLKAKPPIVRKAAAR